MRYELYKFSHGTREWLFTSNVKAVEFSGKTYQPVKGGISRTNIEDSGIDKADFDITFAQIKLLNEDNIDLSELFINRILFDSVLIDLIELNNNESLVLFKGRIVKPSFDEDEKTMTLTASSGETYQNRSILTRKFQRSCPNKIYDRFCGLDFEKWSSKATVTNINGLNVVVSFLPIVVIEESTDIDGNAVKKTTTTNTFFNGTIINKTDTIITQTTNSVTGEVTETIEVKAIFTRESSNPYARGLIVKDGVNVYIANANGLSLTLYRHFPNLAQGDEVLIAMGCDQSFESCKTFQNSLRYMGFPFMPNTNPVHDQIIK